MQSHWSGNIYIITLATIPEESGELPATPDQGGSENATTDGHASSNLREHLDVAQGRDHAVYDHASGGSPREFDPAAHNVGAAIPQGGEPRNLGLDSTPRNSIQGTSCSFHLTGTFKPTSSPTGINTDGTLVNRISPLPGTSPSRAPARPSRNFIKFGRPLDYGSNRRNRAARRKLHRPQVRPRTIAMATLAETLLVFAVPTRTSS
jgi:hypothetical protein